MPSVEPTIFYMDMRAFGKGFETYYEPRQGRVRRALRARPWSLDRQGAPADHEPDRCATSTRTGAGHEEEFDLVVLSVGLVPSREHGELAERLGVELRPLRLLRRPTFCSPVATSRAGRLRRGAFAGPKDIPETVIERQRRGRLAAASCCRGARHAGHARRVYPPERDVAGEAPRIGVFVCHCGINIAGVVDVPTVVEYARTLPGVVYAEENLYTCSQDTQEKINETIQRARASTAWWWPPARRAPTSRCSRRRCARRA